MLVCESEACIMILQSTEPYTVPFERAHDVQKQCAGSCTAQLVGGYRYFSSGQALDGCLEGVDLRRTYLMPPG